MCNFHACLFFHYLFQLIEVQSKFTVKVCVLIIENFIESTAENC
jgi:hypothetical protein